MEIHQSALMDHCASKNNMIDWEGVRLLAKETDWNKRGVKEVGDKCNQPGCGVPPCSRSLLEAVHSIHSSDEGSCQSRNILACKNFLPNSKYPQ